MRLLKALIALTILPLSLLASNNTKLEENLYGLWHVNAIQNTKLTQKSPLSISLNPGGSLFGSGGCNQLFGKYTVDNKGIRFENITRTRMMCDEKRMATENSFLKALEMTQQLEWSHDKLILKDQKNNAILTLSKVPDPTALINDLAPPPSASAFKKLEPKSMETITMKISSDVFMSENEIPSLYTCEGKDISPPLTWQGIPEKTKSLALIVDDPDAPDPAAPKMVWTHWVLYNLSPKVTGLPENVTLKNLPAGTLAGLTNWNKPNYGGPCPPIGRHRYYFKLYALDTLLPNLQNPTVEVLQKAMKGHILAEAVLMGTYQKKKV